MSSYLESALSVSTFLSCVILVNLLLYFTGICKDLCDNEELERPLSLFCCGLYESFCDKGLGVNSVYCDYILVYSDPLALKRLRATTIRFG